MSTFDINAITNLLTIQNLAVISGLLYLLLLIRENILAWFFGFLTSAIFTYLSLEAKIYFHAMLNFYYMLIPIYAYLIWRKKDSNNKPLLKIHEMKLMYHALIFIVGIPLIFILSYLAKTFSDSQITYLDAAIFVFALAATIMQARKIISNWLYWIIINAVTVYLYLLAGFSTVIILPIIYTVLPLFGYFNWIKLKKQNNKNTELNKPNL